MFTVVSTSRKTCTSFSLIPPCTKFIICLTSYRLIHIMCMRHANLSRTIFPLKTSENFQFLDVSRRHRKRPVTRKVFICFIFVRQRRTWHNVHRRINHQKNFYFSFTKPSLPEISKFVKLPTVRSMPSSWGM